MKIKNKELKQILEKIVEEEKKEYNLEFDFHYIGKATYFKKIEEISKIKMNRISKIINRVIFVNIGGFQNQKEQIIVLFDSIPAKINKTELIFSLYHEIGHAIDNSREYQKLNIYDDLIYYLDRYYLQIKNGKYMTNTLYHDLLSYEILADKYAIEKTKEFFKKNPQYEFDQKWLNNKEKDILQRYESYDLSGRIDKIISIKELRDKLIWKFPFYLFIKEDGSFKSLDSICSNLKKYEFNNDKTTKAFLSTKAFQKSFDINTVSEESVKYLVSLFNKKKKRKLKVQKHIKFNDIKEATTFYKTNNIGALCILNLMVFLTYTVSFENLLLDPESLQIFAFIYVNGLSTIVVVIKDIVEILRNKYDINIREEKVEEFISLIKEQCKEEEQKTI